MGFQKKLGFQRKPGFSKKKLGIKQKRVLYRKAAFQIQKVLGFQKKERLKVCRKMTSNKQLGACMSLMGHRTFVL